MVKYVAVREDGYIVVTKSRRRAQRVMNLYYKMKWANRGRWLEIHGNVIEYRGRKYIEPRVYTIDEFMEAINAVSAKWRKILREFVSRPVTMKDRPTLPKVEVPPLRIIRVDKPHLRQNRFGTRYMIPRPIDYEYWICDEDAVCGRSEFKETVWFWVQDRADMRTYAVILRKGATEAEFIDRLTSLGGFEADSLMMVCEHMARQIDQVSRLCALHELVK